LLILAIVVTASGLQLLPNEWGNWADPRARQRRAGRARPEGKTLGRPRTDDATETAIRKVLAKGDAGMCKIAKGLGVGTGTVQRTEAEMAAS
jgi:hypothetical protein